MHKQITKLTEAYGQAATAAPLLILVPYTYPQSDIGLDVELHHFPA
jgi:hypothetical protein